MNIDKISEYQMLFKSNICEMEKPINRKLLNMSSKQLDNNYLGVFTKIIKLFFVNFKKVKRLNK